MNCLSCHLELQSGNKFCPNCGTPAGWMCGGCGASNQAGFMYCGRCGTRFAGVAAGPRARPEGGVERRQVTIMFVDLVGSTALSASLDPEDLTQLIGAYQRCVADVVMPAGGFIARYVGDGILVYFGFPQMREDDPEQAVRCSLSVVRAVEGLATGEIVPGGVAGGLKVRIGIATGLVVVGDLVGSGASMQVTAMGEAPNIAARLQAEAGPGRIVIAESTRRLTGRLFDYDDLGLIAVKGLDRPVQAFAVVGERRGISRYAALRPSRADLVGRQEELQVLLNRWEEVAQGGGRAVLISGEPGIGKSRLIAAFEKALGNRTPEMIHLACAPNGTDTPLFPVRQELERAAALHHLDTAPVLREKLRGHLGPLALGAGHAAALTELLTGLPRGADAAEAETPRRQKERMFAAIDDYLSAMRRGAALIVVLEDLHWADPTTREWLDRRIESLDAWPMLILATTRPDSPPAWSSAPLVANVVLNRLHQRQAGELIRQMMGGGAAAAVVDTIVARSDGLPLFIEELTQAVLEHSVAAGAGPGAGGAPDGTSEAIPTSLQALLFSRLDGLGAAKEIAQVAATIGREFSFPLLERVTDKDRAALQEGLLRLVGAGLITSRGDVPASQYVFKHALVQEAAYRSILRKRRRALHSQIAAVLETVEGVGTSADPQQVAWHFGKAGRHEQSIGHYRRAAAQATGRYALAERAQHLRKAIGQARLMASDAGRLRLELDLLIELGLVLIDTSGSGSDEVRATFEQARELAHRLQDHEKLLVILDALALNFHFARSESGQMLLYAAELAAVDEAGGHRLAGVWASRMRSSARLLQGEFAEARQGMEDVIQLYEELKTSVAGTRMARDPRVSTYGNLGICLAAMGLTEAGAAASAHSLAYAEESGSITARIVSLRRACVQAMIMRDVPRALALSSRLMALNEAHETFTGLREGTIAYGWASLSAAWDEALSERVLGCLGDLDAARHLVYLPFMMGCVAEQFWVHGSHKGAAALLGRAWKLTRLTGENWSAAELLRLRAVCRQHEGARPDGARTMRLLQASIKLAKEQGALWWELRAATDLAEAWSKGGETKCASALLTPLLARYDKTSGLMSLVRARALLSGGAY